MLSKWDWLLAAVICGIFLIFILLLFNREEKAAPPIAYETVDVKHLEDRVLYLLKRIQKLEEGRGIPRINITATVPGAVRIFPVNGELVVEALDEFEAVEEKRVQD